MRVVPAEEGLAVEGMRAGLRATRTSSRKAAAEVGGVRQPALSASAWGLGEGRHAPAGLGCLGEAVSDLPKGGAVGCTPTLQMCQAFS